MHDRNADLIGKCGSAVVTFRSQELNMSMGFESVPTHYAASVMTALATAAGKSTPVLVESASVVDNTTINTPSDGGDNMEKRIAVLEAEVAHIKTDVADIKAEQRAIAANAASASSDIKVVLQKLIDIDTNLSSKAGKDFVESKISGMKAWLLGILLLSIAMPVISFLLNLYLKKI